MDVKPMLQPNRANTILYCKRWLETVEFYRVVVGLPVNFENNWFVEFNVTDSSFLSIANAAKATIESVGGQGVTLSWQVENLASVRDELRSRAIPTSEIHSKWGSLVFYFHDPEGHRIEFWQS